jgi:hypothetical protein
MKAIKTITVLLEEFFKHSSRVVEHGGMADQGFTIAVFESTNVTDCSSTSEVSISKHPSTKDVLLRKITEYGIGIQSITAE